VAQCWVPALRIVQRLAVMPVALVVSAGQPGCHIYFARWVTFVPLRRRAPFICRFDVA
jgi:hypothetical protein